jgi:hypothetical protein
MTASAGSTMFAAPAAEGRKLSAAALLTASGAGRWTLRLLYRVMAARLPGPERFGVDVLRPAVLEIGAAARGTALLDFLTREAAKDPAPAWNLGCPAADLRVVDAVPAGAAQPVRCS